MLVRVERFELITKLILSQPPLPIGLHAREEIRISEFEFRNLIWYRRRDSNPHCLVPKTSASSRLGYAGGNISDFELRSSNLMRYLRESDQFAIRISKIR